MSYPLDLKTTLHPNLRRESDKMEKWLMVKSLLEFIMVAFFILGFFNTLVIIIGNVAKCNLDLSVPVYLVIMGAFIYYVLKAFYH